jgi:hypothetical protein
MQDQWMPQQDVVPVERADNNSHSVGVVAWSVKRDAKVCSLPDQHHSSSHDRRRRISQPGDRPYGIQPLSIRAGTNPADIRLVPIVNQHVHLRLGNEPALAQRRIGAGQARLLHRANHINRRP